MINIHKVSCLCKIWILVCSVFLIQSYSSQAQVNDGVNQSSPVRLSIPFTVNIHNGEANSTPYIGYMYSPAKWINATFMSQYNISEKAFTPQIWVGFVIKDQFYFLSRSLYNSKTGRYSHGFAATFKIRNMFMIDATWTDFYNGKSFFDNDRFQLLAGYAHKKFVINAGYSMLAYKGLIANARFYITKKLWLQVKYDGGFNNIVFSSIFNFDNSF